MVVVVAHTELEMKCEDVAAVCEVGNDAMLQAAEAQGSQILQHAMPPLCSPNAVIMEINTKIPICSS